MKRKKEVIVVSNSNNIEQGYMSESSSAFEDGEDEESPVKRSDLKEKFEDE